MRELSIGKLCWLALRASTALALTIAPYHVTLHGGAKIVLAMAHAEGEGGGGEGGGGEGGGGDGGDGDGGDSGDHDSGDHDGGDDDHGDNDQGDDDQGENDQGDDSADDGDDASTPLVVPN